MKAKLLLTIFFGVAISAIMSAQWSAPGNLSPAAISAGLNESMGSCIGVSGDTLHVVWTDKLSSARAAIYYTRSLDTGMTWSLPIAITSLNGNAWNPAIAVNGGNVHVVWRDIDTGNGRRASWYKHSLDGGNTWGPNVFLDSTADWPAVSVSDNYVYVANDIVTQTSPYNTEMFFLLSTDNGLTWSSKRQLTFAVGRSEDEAIAAQGSHVYMSWNDNRTGQFQIFFKESTDYGATWGPDVVVAPPFDYGTMVYADGANVDVVSAGHPSSSHYQILLAQSADTGTTWGASMNITNDTAHTYYYPCLARNGPDIHVVCGGSAGARYFHSGNGGATWDPPFGFTGNSTFIAYTGCALHIIYVNAAHNICYMRNPTGNAGHCAAPADVVENEFPKNISVYPNPFHASTTIQFAARLINSSLTMYDIFGRKVRTLNVSGDKIIIDRNLLPCGIYYFTLTRGNKTVAIDKLAIVD